MRLLRVHGSGGTLIFDATASKAVPEFAMCLNTAGRGNCADNTWAASPDVECWRPNGMAAKTRRCLRGYQPALAKSCTARVVAMNEGDADAAAQRPVKTIEAIYEVPYLAHARWSRRIQWRS